MLGIVALIVLLLISGMLINQKLEERARRSSQDVNETKHVTKYEKKFNDICSIKIEDIYSSNEPKEYWLIYSAKDVDHKIQLSVDELHHGSLTFEEGYLIEKEQDKYIVIISSFTEEMVLGLKYYIWVISIENSELAKQKRATLDEVVYHDNTSVIGTKAFRIPWTKNHPERLFYFPVRVNIDKDLHFEPLVKDEIFNLYKSALQEDYNKKMDVLIKSESENTQENIKYFNNIYSDFKRFISGSILDNNS